MAGRPGFEPGLPGPEPGVLPLNYPPACFKYSKFLRYMPIHGMKKDRFERSFETILKDGKLKISGIMVLQ